MDKINYNQYTLEAVDLLCRLIKTPSFSKNEDLSAKIILAFLKLKNIKASRIGNNIISFQNLNKGKPILALNSHHDTIRPSEGWNSDPFFPKKEHDKIIGLGSNDAGGCLVSLLSTFVHFYHQELPFQLMFIASAEEEISGEKGLQSVLKELTSYPSFAIVGEPTEMNLAVAEKGLLVLDAFTIGKSGHVAHQYGQNAIYTAIEDINRIQSIRFDKQSKFLGPVKLTVTQIEAGKQHNVIPDLCHFVIDCRINEYYTNQDILNRIREISTSKIVPRSTHLNSSKTPINHPIIIRAINMGKSIFGSPTLSDQVFFKCPSVKIGPGVSSRSHQANEYILKQEILSGIKDYIKLIHNLHSIKSTYETLEFE